MAMIDWFARNRVLTALLTVTYSVMFIAGHGFVSDLVRLVVAAGGRSVLNGAITILLLGASALLVNSLRRNLAAIRGHRGLPLLSVAMLLVVVTYNTLMVTNVEAIHYLQYALLTIPLFSLGRSYGSSMVWATAIGVIDETWQYLWIYGDRFDAYFDFNDILLNLIGAGLGVSLLSLVGSGKPGMEGHAARACELWLPTFCGLLLILAISAGLVQLYPEAASMVDGQALLLSRSPAPDGFWTALSWGNRYHRVHPYAGLLLVQALILIYGRLDRGQGQRA